MHGLGSSDGVCSGVECETDASCRAGESGTGNPASSAKIAFLGEEILRQIGDWLNERLVLEIARRVPGDLLLESETEGGSDSRFALILRG